MEWIGYLGMTALAICWIPQSIDTIRHGRCDVTLGFLLLSALGSTSLAVYAFSRADVVFVLVNMLTSGGAMLNLYYRLSPRRPAE
jgi:lipid-A-disaccharide synthase-like uncharacterized protein